MELAKEWNVSISFNAFTWLRTKSKDLMLSVQDLEELKDIIRRIIAFKKKNNTVYSSEYYLNKVIEFFENGGIPNCRSGEKFLIVNPDGTLSPCGLIKKDYTTRRDIIENFSRHNTCGSCYTGIRGNTEKPIRHLIKDHISRFY